MQVLYSTEATVEGGRAGRARTRDGRLEVDLAVPTELGGEGGPGTNPEQLFAAGYAACFHSALMSAGSGRRADLDESTVTARVSLGQSGGDYGLAVVLELDAPALTADDAAAIMAAAHGICPYSKATRGNVDVRLVANGVDVAPAAAE
jgi:Ohr subfamily peroxiredoxin